MPDEPDEPDDHPDFEYMTEDERDREACAAAAKYRAAGGDRKGWITIFDGGLSAHRWRRGDRWHVIWGCGLFVLPSLVFPFLPPGLSILWPIGAALCLHRHCRLG
jgi:hypothetical protein